VGTSVACLTTGTVSEYPVSNHEDEHPLQPSLAATEGQLQDALEEVCDETVVESVETDELIRIEESLSIASDAAKKAISIRQRIDADADADTAVGDLAPSENPKRHNKA
jgi:hypothetical protein